MSGGTRTETGEMRAVAQRGADLAGQISAKMRGLDGGLSNVMQTLKGQILSPFQMGHTNSVEAFERLSRTLTEVAGNITMSANKYDSSDGDNHASLARHVDPVAGGSGMNLGSFKA